MSSTLNPTRFSMVVIVMIAAIVPTYYFPILTIGTGGLALRSFDIVLLALASLPLLAPAGWWRLGEFRGVMLWYAGFAVSVAVSTGVLFLVHNPDSEELQRIIRAVVRLYEVLVLAVVAINAMRHVSPVQVFNLFLMVCAVLPLYSIFVNLTTGASFTRIGSYAVKGSAELGIEGNYAQANFNELGSLCGALGAGSAGLFLLSKTMKHRLLYLASLLTYTVGVVLTSSRSGMISEAAGLLVVSIMLSGRLVGKALIVFCPIALITTNPRFYDIMYNRFTETIIAGSHENVSAVTRIEGMNSAWNVFLAHPFIGVGYAGFRLFSTEGFITPESYYLEILADLGIAGAFVLGGLVVHGVWSGMRLTGETRDFFIASGLAPVVTMLVSNLSGNNFFDPSLLMLFLIFLAFGLAFERYASARRSHGTPLFVGRNGLAKGGVPRMNPPT